LREREREREREKERKRELQDYCKICSSIFRISSYKRHSKNKIKNVISLVDYSVVEVLREEPARVTIRGLRRSFYPPSHLPPVDNSPPEKKLQLEWVYGYRGTDTRKNLWVLPSGELLYYVAAVAILFDREENAQRHYIGHTEDIMCMEVGHIFAP